MADPFGDIIGDYRAFAAQQQDRLLGRGIDIRPYPLSHLAGRVPEWDQYVHVRNLLERHAVSQTRSLTRPGHAFDHGELVQGATSRYGCSPSVRRALE
ncbi:MULTISPECIES: hypothetical protein [Nocardioides]|uniref:Uncharacterized protein n=1 Tax=Nocardioides vastitatis TaxID=2568655 RepID=A0ABW0ZKY3_9ACTN|nr:hypothetical protein [Nocardioides sp.]THI96165.1 hypothetical protein E7Z54_17400 [Nocardioides sp.]